MTQPATLDDLRAKREQREDARARRQHVGELRRRNAAQQRAYEAGLNHQDADPSWSLEEHEAHQAGWSDHDENNTPPTPAPAQPAAPVSSSTSTTTQGASLAAGLVAYALALNYLRYGWAGVTGWLSAKFLNKVTLTTSAPSTSASTMAAATTGQFT